MNSEPAKEPQKTQAIPSKPKPKIGGDTKGARSSLLLSIALSLATMLAAVFLISTTVLGYLLLDGNILTIRTNLTRNSISELINSQYIGDKPDDQQILEGELKGLVQSLDDPYSQYLTEEETSEFRNAINEEYEGIGVRFAEREGIFVITQVMDGGPAQSVGVEEEDVLLSIEGEDINNETLEEVVSKIKGPAGTDVTLSFYRGDEEVEFTITRAKIESQTVTLEKDGNIGIIQITSFSDDMRIKMQEVARQIIDDESIDSIIVDLRSNTGGILNSGIVATSFFVDEGDVVTYEVGNDDQRVDKAIAVEPSLKEYPLVVVVDNFSASASEIMAAGIRDNRDGEVLLVGETTFGKGVVQKLFPLPDGGTLKLTVAQWLTPNKEEIDEVGIEPDIEVDSVDAVERAKEVLRG